MLVRGTSILFGIMGSIFLSTIAASAADMPTKAPAPVGCVQAVDGINSKVAGWGGSFANKSIYGGTGSLALPLGCEFGAQIDAGGASFDSRFLASIAGHLFWRDPAVALVGLYGSYTYWNSQIGGVRANHIGPEAEWYIGRWTLQGVAGVEFGNNASGTVGNVIQTYDIKTRFFDQVNVGYYLQDNFKLFIGQRYLGGKDALALGGEYGIPMNNGVMAALFAEGRVGESSFHGIWGGLRFYFDQKDKTLIRRHREDDPGDWESGFGSVQNGGTSQQTPTQPQPPPVFSCFTGVTQILMANGTTRSIAEVKVGDQVLGENGEVNKVVDIETPVLRGRKLYAFNDGPAFVTPEHPFMTRAGWKSIAPEATLAETGSFSVGALKVGDEVVQLTAVATRVKPMAVAFGGRVPAPTVEVLIETEFSALASITPHDGDPLMTVYNLKLDGNHTYFANNYLVHNKF